MDFGIRSEKLPGTEVIWSPLGRSAAQGLIFSKIKCVMASSSGWLRGKRAECSQCGAAEERFMTRLITPMTRAQVYGLLIKTAPGTRRCSVGE